MEYGNGHIGLLKLQVLVRRACGMRVFGSGFYSD
jgi:hypothetical protein